MSEEVNITCGRCNEKIIIDEESKLTLVGNALGVQCGNCGKTQITSKAVLGVDRYKKFWNQLSNKKKDKKREEEEQARQKEKEQVYKSTNPREIMFEVARSPLLSLKPKQVDELQDLAEDYEGTLSPDIFKRIIANFQGVSKEQAEFAKERYWIKLQKARERMSVAQAEKIGLLSGTHKSYGGHQSDEGDLGEIVKIGIAEGIKEGRKGLNVNSDVLSQPLGEALSNMAQTTGLINRFINRVVITAFEEEAKANPLFRKQIVGKAGFFMSRAKGESEGEEGQRQRKGKSEEEAGEEEEEEVFDKRKGGEKEKNIFGELDKYFEEEE